MSERDQRRRQHYAPLIVFFIVAGALLLGYLFRLQIARAVLGNPPSVHPMRISLGAASDYSELGGEPVESDDCIETTPHNLSDEGLVFAPDGPTAGRRLIAAYRIGAATEIHARIWLTSDSKAAGQSGFIRAKCRNEIRIPETAVHFADDGTADAELSVRGIPADRVRTVQEEWTWEYRPNRWFSDYQSNGGSVRDARVQVCIYFAAADPINCCPRESFYHVACARGGATDARQAEASVWSYFGDFTPGAAITNAAGKRLTYWQSYTPSDDFKQYIGRDAQALVTTTDSSCCGWANLLHEALAIHGIKSTVMGLRLRDDASTLPKIPVLNVPDGVGGRKDLHGLAFIPRGFHWDGTDHAGCSKAEADEYLLEPGDFRWTFNAPARCKCIDWQHPGIQNEGRPSHGNTIDAAGPFDTHAVLRIREGQTERWYDPSYGIGPRSSLADYEADFFGKGRPDCGGLIAIVGVKLRQAIDANTGRCNSVGVEGELLGAVPVPANGQLFDAVEVSSED
jgi:hypothetical protein